MSFFKDLKEDIAQSVNELTESLDENLTVDDEKTKETVPMSELTTDFPPEEPKEEVPELVVENSETERCVPCLGSLIIPACISCC